MYGKTPFRSQAHTNHQSIFDEIADLVEKSCKKLAASNFGPKPWEICSLYQRLVTLGTVSNFTLLIVDNYIYITLSLYIYIYRYI